MKYNIILKKLFPFCSQISKSPPDSKNFTVDLYFGVVFSTGHPKSAKNQYQFQCTTLTEGEFLLITIEMNLHLHASEYGGFEMLMITKMLLASASSHKTSCILKMWFLNRDWTALSPFTFRSQPSLSRHHWCWPGWWMAFGVTMFCKVTHECSDTAVKITSYTYRKGKWSPWLLLVWQNSSWQNIVDIHVLDRIKVDKIKVVKNRLDRIIVDIIKVDKIQTWQNKSWQKQTWQNKSWQKQTWQNKSWQNTDLIE